MFYCEIKRTGGVRGCGREREEEGNQREGTRLQYPAYFTVDRPDSLQHFGVKSLGLAVMCERGKERAEREGRMGYLRALIAAINSREVSGNGE
jgi:hypothetical protein